MSRYIRWEDEIKPGVTVRSVLEDLLAKANESEPQEPEIEMPATGYNHDVVADFFEKVQGFDEWENVRPAFFGAYPAEPVDGPQTEAEWLRMIDNLIETGSVYAKTGLDERQISGFVQSALDYACLLLRREGVEISRDRSTAYGYYR